MKKSAEDSARGPASTITTLVIGNANQNVFSPSKDEAALNMDSSLLLELLKAFDLVKEKKKTTIETEFEQSQSGPKKGSPADPTVKHDNTAKTIRKQPRTFDARNYSRLKTSQIICRNGGTKLTPETLVELACTGAKLIPSLSF